VQNVDGVAAAAPISVTTGKIVRDKIVYKDNLFIGTNGDLPGLLNQSVAYGSFLNYEDEGTNAAVLGDKAAKRLFDEELPLGRTFYYHGEEFVVRGILNEMNTTPLTEQADFNNAIFVSDDIAQKLSNNTAPIYQILARPGDSSKAASVAAKVQSALYRSHGFQDNFKVITGGKDYDNNGTILSLLTQMITGVAAISLLVGGIGIMNVMLVSVAERVHEIGIRKAVGASNKQILSQFVIEASVLSLIGGVLGIGLAMLINVLLRLFSDLKPVISWQIVLVAIFTSLLVGVLFGTFPALKAARKDPIDALRA
jgi:ABC-type antimicrobial peptide transport system permease subunit